MPAIHRKGDQGGGHGCWPPRPNIQGSSNVFCNGIAVHTQGMAWSFHCCPKQGCHGGVLAGGSSSVYANNKQLGRRGDPVSCGSIAIGGSSNVFAGG